MLTIPVYNPAGEQIGEETIDPDDFGGAVNKQLLHEVVLMHLAARRVGTVNTRGRADVAGSGKKLFRQKGTGNARAGSKRTHKRKGGGVAFARRNRDYRYSMPKKSVRAAVRMALLVQVSGPPGARGRRPGAEPAQDERGRQDLPCDQTPRPERGRIGRVGRRNQGPGPRADARAALDPVRPAGAQSGPPPERTQYRGREGRPGGRVQHLRHPETALPDPHPRGPGRSQGAGQAQTGPARPASPERVHRPTRRRANHGHAYVAPPSISGPARCWNLTRW